MDTGALLALAIACAPTVHPATTAALVEVESGFNPHAIGVVGGALYRQPRSRAEAITTARFLDAGGWSYSAGLAQINSRNFLRLGLNASTAFDPCANLKAMEAVLSECLARSSGTSQRALRHALSCYYSGDPDRGLRDGYVARVLVAAGRRRSEVTPFLPISNSGRRP